MVLSFEHGNGSTLFRMTISFTSIVGLHDLMLRYVDGAGRIHTPPIHRR